MSADLKLWIAIVGIALTGVLTRCSFVVFFAGFRLPPLVERALQHAPAAALAAIMAPSLLVSDGRLDLAPGNHRLVAAAIAALVMWRTRGMLWSMAAGLVAFTALRLYT